MEFVRKTFNTMLALLAAFILFSVVTGYREPDHVLRSYISDEKVIRNVALSRIVDEKWETACFAESWRQFGSKNLQQMYPSILRALQNEGISDAPYDQTKILLIDKETDTFEIQRVSDGFSSKRIMLLGDVEEYCMPVGTIYVRSASSGTRDVVEIYAKGDVTPSG